MTFKIIRVEKLEHADDAGSFMLYYKLTEVQ